MHAFTFRAFVAGLVATLSLSTPATAQTWTGASNGLWNVASNWSSNPALPASGIDTALIFGASSNTAHTQNLLPNPFLLNALTFTSAAPSYSISGNGLDFRTSSVAVAPRITQSSSSAITLGVPLTLTSTLTVSGTGNGQVNLNSALTGAGGLTVGGSGAVSLGSGANTFAGAVNVNGGTLLLGNGAAIPTSRNVTVASGATFNTNGLSNAAGTAIGTVTLNSATLRIPTGSGDYFINRLVMNSGGAVDFTGATSADLHFTGAGAGIPLSGSGSLTGGGTSRILNDTAAPIDITLSGSASSSVRLANGALGQGFRLTGAGGLMTLTNTGNTANLTVDNNAYVQVADMAFLGTGTITLANTTALAIPGTLYYIGGSASSSKALTLGSGGGQIWVGTTGTNLTLSGVISESVVGQRLVIAGDSQLSSSPGSTLTLTANNSYTGPTVLGYGGVLSIPTIANGGVASPLGASSSAPANLLIGGHPATGSATLQYTGPTATTDRGATLGPSASTIEVTSAATNLTVGGQLTGSGTLIKAGPGTLTLTNATSNYNGGAIINAGPLSIGAGGAVLPAGSAVVVATGGELNLGNFSNASGSALGTITLNGGVLRVPAGSGNYFINNLVTGTGGALDFSGSTSFDLHFVNAGAGITVNGNNTWTGSVGSRLVNDISTSIDLAVAPGVTLTNGISLAGSGYSVTGGGTLYQTATTGNTAPLTVQQARLRIDSAGALGTGTLTLDAGTLQWSGPTATVVKPVTLSTGGGTVDVSNAATVLTLPSSITGSGALVKTGPGTLVLNNLLNVYSGGITVAAGRLDVSGDDRLGLSNPTVNALGTLRYTGSTSTARTFNLIDGTLEAPTGVTLTLNGATIGGGFLRGSGTFALTGNTALIGVSTASSTTINQTGAATVTNFSNGGTFSVAAGQILNSNGVTNTSSGQLTVNGTASVSDFVSNGLVIIPNGGVLNNTGSPLVLGGGSRTYIGSAAVPGGEINLGGQTLELNGALLVNDGTVTGTVNVNYGSSAMGSGTYGVVNLNTGAVYAPGSSPGISTVAALTFDNTPVPSGAPTLAIELGGTAPGTQYDQVHVTGNLSLGGALTVSLIDGFAPVAGQAFDILDWGSLSGKFASINLPTLVGLTWNTSQLYTSGVLSLAAVGLSGDYNQNGAVDAADYVLWRKNLGSATTLANDDTPGVGPDDYDRWRAHFGQTTGSGSSATANAAVPEPATDALLILGTLAIYGRRRAVVS